MFLNQWHFLSCMDSIDKAILKELEQDARKSFLSIAKKLKVSEGTIRQRVQKLKLKGIIQKFTVKVKDKTTAIVGIQIRTGIKIKDTLDTMHKLDIDSVYALTGRFDILCVIKADTFEDTNDMIEMLRSVEGVIHTETFTVLKEY